jgi:hypothetical protein
VAALHDLGVAGHDLDAGLLGRPRRGLYLGAQLVGGQALLQHQREAQGERPRARHRQVVHGAVHRELADRAAREADRLDDEAVSGQGQPRAVHRHRARVAELRKRVVGEGGQQQALDERLAGLAAGAVRHRDVGVLELRLLGAGRLDDPEDPFLSGGFGHTTSRSVA